jgi:Asp-tRNA(Asn)/Glu-tRNA(Gln) amidotransferase A subunit family amidase
MFLDVVEAVSDVCRRIDAVDSRLHSFVPEIDRHRRLSEEAHQLAGIHFRTNDHPFLGVPVGVKDIVSVDGLDTQAGSSLPAAEFGGPEARAVRALRRAGALIAGKTVTTEFAYADPGPTVNPHDPERSPGGSSSGSAAAVAAGIVPLALGTQTVDSIITPAAYCGVVGFKPTYGRTSLDGVLPFSPSMDHLGVLAHSVEWVTTAMTVLMFQFQFVAAPVETTLGIPATSFIDQADYKVVDHFHRIVDLLGRHGHRIVTGSVPADPLEVTRVHREINAAQFFLEHRARFERYGHRFGLHSTDLFAEGEALGPHVVSRGERSGLELRHAVTDEMNRLEIDAWITPAATGPAPIGLDAHGDTAMAVPWTHAHLPAIAVPAGIVDGVPVGIQIVGRHGDDAELLAIASKLANDLAGSIETAVPAIRV